MYITIMVIKLAIPCNNVINVNFLYPSDIFNDVLCVTIQKYESLAWDTVIAPEPNEATINAIIQGSEIFILCKIGNKIELPIIKDEVLEPWLVFNKAQIIKDKNKI